MYYFTADEVIAEVRKDFDEPICLDFIDDARQEKDIKNAASIIMIDSALWNGTF